MLRFAILKNVDKNGTEKVVLELDQDTLKWRLAAIAIQELVAKKKPFRGFTDEVIGDAVKSAFDKLIQEFKNETVRIQ